MGLTNRQAEVYLATVELGQPTAASIAQHLQIARAEVYRAIPELRRLGLIIKIVATPTVFTATPLSEGIAILLERDNEKFKAIRNETQKFLRNIKIQREKTEQKNSQHTIAVGFKPVTRQYLRDLSQTQTSKDCILEWRLILAIVNRDFALLKEILKKGVKIRFITDTPEGAKIPRIIQTLMKMGSFEVKSASAVPKAGLDMFDKKIVHIITVSSSDRQEIEVLRSDNPAVVDLLQDYFELKWQTATTLASTETHK